jgi:hypothetical protein
MSRLSRIGRTFTACVGKSGTIDDTVTKSNGKPNSFKIREKAEDQQVLLDLPDVLSEEFYERVRKDAVVVEYLDHSNGTITGYVSVRNDAPDKRVFARYTTDRWETHGEIEAEWLGSTDGQNCDKFRFIINSLGTSYTVFLAVRYEVLEQHYWDNNDHNNYEVVHGEQKHY